ncbi:hypothetical protein ACLOJK_004045 [Asimina triloba]
MQKRWSSRALPILTTCLGRQLRGACMRAVRRCVRWHGRGRRQASEAHRQRAVAWKRWLTQRAIDHPWASHWATIKNQRPGSHDPGICGSWAVAFVGAASCRRWRQHRAGSRCGGAVDGQTLWHRCQGRFGAVYVMNGLDQQIGLADDKNTKTDAFGKMTAG